MNKKKTILTLLIFITLLIVGISVTFAYFTAEIKVESSSSKVEAQTKVNDKLSYRSSKDINLQINLENFNKNSGNIKDTADLNVTLTSRLANYAKYNYSLYFEIKRNTFIYSTLDKKPELLLKVTDPNENVITEIEGLNYVTLNGESGFDITEERDDILISKDYNIETADTTNQTWKFEIIFLNLDDIQNDNSGKNLEASLKIKEKAQKEYTMYSWNEIPFLDANIDTTIKELKNMEISSLYHSFRNTNFKDGSVANVVSKLKQNNINVYWLTGDYSWYNNIERIKAKIDELYNYNSLNSENSIKGIVLDIEWHIVAALKEIPIDTIEVYANTISEAYDYAKKRGIVLVNCIPFNYDKYFADDSQYNDSEKARAKVAFEKIISNADRISIMNYQRNLMLTRLENEIPLAKKYNKRIETIAEFGRLKDSNKTTTLEVDADPIGYAKRLWSDIENHYNYAKLGYSYHYLNQALFVVQAYDRIAFKLLLNDEEIESDNLNVLFDTGECSEMKSGSDAHLPKNKKYDFYVDGYETISEERDTLDDKTKLYTLNLKNASKNTLEIYPRIYNESTNNYTAVSEGTITLTRKSTKEKYNTSVNDNKYATTRAQILNNTEYIITYVDANGVLYTLDYAKAKNQSGEIVYINNKNKNMVIPSGFKTNLYVTPTFYFSKAN